ncbi:MAG: MopE-related protein [Pseudomonadota bacterium]|nr:MopE-related protein [Pseudomonadota bacterium]
MSRLLQLLLLSGCVATTDGSGVEASPGALDLGTVAIGQVGLATITIINQGPGIADIHGIGLAHGADPAWSVRSADTADLFAGATSLVEIAFAPEVTGSAQARLEIRSDDPDRPVLEVPLVAVGVDQGSVDSGDTGDTGETGDTEPADTVDDDADGFSEADGDCDDGDTSVHPGAAEACDGVDEDCSGVADDRDDDRDGHSPCDAGGDCDDADATAYPLLVEASGAETGDGTAATPFGTLDQALAQLDVVCRTVVLLPGTHAAAVSWDSGTVTVRGAGDTAGDVVLTPPAGGRAFTVGGTGRLDLDTLTLAGARPATGDGGAVQIEGGAVTLTAVRLSSNTSAENGGAIALDGGTLTLDGCVLEGNTAADEGGAVYAYGGTVHDRGSTWSDNVAGDGGALATDTTTLDVDGSTFTDNVADDAGGAFFGRSTDATLDGAVFQANQAGWQGGAIALDGAPAGLVRNLLLVGNRAGNEGGGLAISGSAVSLVVANNTLVGNEASGDGGGLYLRPSWDSSVYLGSNVVAWSAGRNGVSCSGEDARGVEIAHTLAYENDGDDLELGRCADAGENLVADPRFDRYTDDGDPTDDLYTLGADSPAVDSGPDDGDGPSGYIDWGDPDGSRNDRGYTGGPGAR